MTSYSDFISFYIIFIKLYHIASINININIVIKLTFFKLILLYYYVPDLEEVVSGLTKDKGIEDTIKVVSLKLVMN